MKTGSYFVAILLLLVPAGVGFGQEATPTNAVASTNAVAEESLRDPFLPLDFAPAGAVPVAVTPTQNVTSAVAAVPVAGVPVAPVAPATNVAPVAIKWPVLKVRGLIKAGSTYVANIDGVSGIVESGRIVKRRVEGIEFSWQVGDITEKGVEIKPLEARPIP